jgi:hypothetical protein
MSPAGNRCYLRETLRKMRERARRRRRRGWGF